MKNHPVSERGQVLVLIALGIIGLVGITGLAIDGSNVLADRRHAQNAADTAAMAGALTYIQQCELSGCDDATEIASARSAMKVDAFDRADSNGYAGDLIRSQVEVYSCDEAGASCPAPYTGDADYLQVIITSHIDTFFARVLGISKLHNKVQAVALADDDDTGPLFAGAAIYALNPDCPPSGSLILNGGNNTNLTITGGGLASNSNDACAVKCGLGTSSVLTMPGGITTAGGGFNWAGQCTSSSFPTSNTAPQLDYHADIPDVPEPPECDSSDPSLWPTQTFINYYDPVDGAYVTASQITPGYYNGFPPQSFNGVATKNTIVMEPGIYCVDSVVKQVQQTVHLYGDDVTIYVRPGNKIQINGGVVQLRATNGNGAPYAPYGNSNEEYKGYLFIAAPDYSGTVTTCDFDGNALNIYVGAIFAPHCDVTINGNGDTPPDGIITQIIGYNVKINGSANMTIKYDEDLMPVVPDPSVMGLTH